MSLDFFHCETGEMTQWVRVLAVLDAGSPGQISRIHVKAEDASPAFMPSGGRQREVMSQNGELQVP